MPNILCKRCSKQIESKKDLATGNFLFLIYPYHTDCFSESKKTAEGIFLRGPINGKIYTLLSIFFTFLFLLVFITAVIKFGIENILTFIVLFFSLFFFFIPFSRAYSFFVYESKLPNKNVMNENSVESETKREANNSVIGRVINSGVFPGGVSGGVLCSFCNNEILSENDLVSAIKNTLEYKVYPFHNQCFTEKMKNSVMFKPNPVNSANFSIEKAKYLLFVIVIALLEIIFFGSIIYNIFSVIFNPEKYSLGINFLSQETVIPFTLAIMGILIIISYFGYYVGLEKQHKRLIEKIKGNKKQ